MTDRRLAAELIALLDEDRRTRARLAADGSLYDGYHPEMEAVHRRNAARLREVITERGWPGRALVGDEASAAAWTILQHSIGEPDFMREGLRLVREAAAGGDVPPIEVAMLEDRVRTYEGRGQLYGTQWDWDDDGRMSPLPLDDPGRVDERRAEVGLPPLADEVRRRRDELAEEPPPADAAQRRRQADEWARRVGWRKPSVQSRA